MDEPIVSVRGDVVLEVEPEVARVDVSVGAQDKDREDTLAALDRRSSGVLALVESFGEAVEKTETASVRIGPVFKDGKPRERIVGYSAVVRHQISVVDFTRLGDSSPGSPSWRWSTSAGRGGRCAATRPCTAPPASPPPATR
ncbi:MAG TPA: SIMPL domain-containing protein [Mycobacteriales bacterium]